MLLTTPSYGQDIPAQIGPAYNNMFYGPPHNVIYWEGFTYDAAGNNILNSLASPCDPNNGPTGGGSGTSPSGCYTDVILSSVFPLANSGCTQLNYGNLYGLNLQTAVQTLHNAGKTVLISFGASGPNLSSQQYADCAPPPGGGNGNMSTLIQLLVDLVQQNNFDGVDIDFEDTSSFGNGIGGGGPQLYDGVLFLQTLTEGLGTQLGFPHNIITHAPQTPYWTSTYTSNNSQIQTYALPPYVEVYNQTAAFIAWFNEQFYNNGDSTVSAKMQEYTGILNSVVGTGSPGLLPPIRLVFGLPICTSNTVNNNNDEQLMGCGGDYLVPGDVTSIIQQLQAQYPDQFGGIMGWVADQDNGPNGNWNSQVWNALKTYQDKWYAYDDQTQQCVTDAGGTVVVETCAGGSNLSQFWQFSANAIINQSTKNCLDAQNGIHTQPCSAGDLYQLWQFFGNSNGGVTVVSRNSLYGLLYNGGTAYCLDASLAPPDLPCNGNTYQSWMGGAQ
jgi:chitinase